MKIKGIIALIVCLSSLTTHAESILDSLIQQGKRQIIASELDSARNTLEMALGYATKTKDYKKRAIICNNLGVVEWEAVNYQKGILAYEEAVSTYQKLGNDTLIAQSKYNLGVMLKRLGNYELSIKNLLEAVLLFEKIDDEKHMAMAFDVLGNIQKDLGNYEKSIEYHQSAHSRYNQISDDKRMSRSLHNLGQVYLKMEEFEKAQKLLFKARRIKEKLGLSLASNHAQIGVYYQEKGDLDSAEYYFQLSADERIKNKKRTGLVTAYLHLGKLFLEKNEYRKSKSLLDKAFFLADSLQLNQDLIEIIEAQIITEKSLGNKSLSKKYERLLKLKEIVQGESSRKELARLEVEHDSYKKDQEIKEKGNQLELERLENERLSYRSRMTMLGLGIAILFLGTIAVFYWNVRKRKKEVEKTNQQLVESNHLIDNLHKELSHRTKNYFQMVGGMLKLDRNKASDDRVSEMLSKYIHRVEAMSQIQRYLLNSDNVSDQVQLNLYLKDLLASVDLALNDDENVLMDIRFEEVVCDYDKALRLGLVVNEMVSNSFEHGFKEINDPELSVQLVGAFNQQICITVTDNGSGFSKTSGTSESKGISLVKMILKSINGELSYESLPGRGTCAKIIVSN